MIFVIKLSTAILFLVLPRKQNFSLVSRDWPFIHMPGQSSAMSISCFVHTNLLSSFSLPLILLHLICTQHLQDWQRMELLSTTFLQTAQENLPFTVIFPAFSLRIITFVFLTFALNPSDSHGSFQAPSLLFKPSNNFLTNTNFINLSSFFWTA